MTVDSSIAWPPSFAGILSSPPAGFSVSQSVIKPVLIIARADTGYRAIAGGKISRKGKTTCFPVPCTGADYIIDGITIRPLPGDIADNFSRILRGRDPENLSFSDVLALDRESDGSLPLTIEDEVFATANQLASSVSLSAPIAGLNATLYPYQDQGIAWMNQSLKLTGGLILADEMGLGKTLQIIGVLMTNPPHPEAPALIICPTTLIANWVREIGKFAPSLTVAVHRGSDRAGIQRKLLGPQIIVTTYDTVMNDISLLRSVDWSFVIIDEAQAIKNPRSQRRSALVQLRRRRTIAMTGTPVENSLKDLWALADFAIPGILGSESAFELMFPDDAGSAHQLSRLTDPFILRRRVADIAQDLPERIDVDFPVELDAGMAAEYERIRQETLDEYPVAGALVATGQLQLYCAHPWLQADTVDGDWEDSVSISNNPAGPLITPKIAHTLEILDECFRTGKKVLIFSIFNAVGQLLRKAASDSLPDAYWGAINGSTEQSRRQLIVDEFTNHDGPGVLILNPKAAGAGLNITAATVVIHYTQVWNPAIEAQASARAYRRGQDLPVTIYRLFYDNTVERVMLDRTLWKKQLANDAVAITREMKEGDLNRALSISPLAVAQIFLL